jgi:hypothetical protein
MCSMRFSKRRGVATWDFEARSRRHAARFDEVVEIRICARFYTY